MDTLMNYLQTNTTVILLSIIIVQLLLLAAWLSSTLKIKKMSNKYKAFIKGSEKNNLEVMLMEHLQGNEKTQQILKKQQEEIRNLEKKTANCVQKVYTKRYNAFDNTGSDLSYSTVLLDGENSGLLLTGIYGRDYAASYAKPIHKGSARQALSMEENEALKAAINQKV